MSPERAKFEAALSAIGDRTPDAVEYQQLCQIAMTHALTDRLRALDPFSPEYKATVFQIYHDLRGSDRAYEADRDERSNMTAPPQNLWRDVSPWSFNDSGLMSEFLFSWGQIMRALALPANSDAKILEYGSGAGQLLLALARVGLRTSTVDIDAASLDLVRTQAAAMQLDIRTERAAFGEGFGDETFDRIIFFEAFHHAIDFGPLLRRLHRRLAPDGRLILCGEPVVNEFLPALPYPWGPRLDGLSVFCIRRYGWMELGFTEAFLIEAFHRYGWLVECLPFPFCGRAVTYVAKPYVGKTIEVGKLVSLGARDAGWEGFEDTHRWTRGDAMATFPLPDQDGASRVTILASNPFPRPVRVTFHDGDKLLKEIVMAAGSDHVEIVIGPCRAAFFGMKAAGNSPKTVLRNSTDTRNLGLMVHSIRVDPV
jgi:2-polyprenyl-3-methyl-5-hydroxy-6-metoxy-1,4-benzoquinol methylase